MLIALLQVILGNERVADEAGPTIGVRDMDIARREFFMGDWVRPLCSLRTLLFC